MKDYTVAVFPDSRCTKLAPPRPDVMANWIRHLGACQHVVTASDGIEARRVANDQHRTRCVGRTA